MTATVLFLAFLHGSNVLNIEFVKAFETREECENYIINEEHGLERMDTYLKYYRENKDTIEPDYRLTLYCETMETDKNA